MYAKPLPSLLELMIEKSETAGSVSFECKNGWCTQCACDKTVLNRIFGPTEYRTPPVIPPTQGKILPCISTQVKFSEDLSYVQSVIEQPNILIHKNESLLARLPSIHEIGSELKTLGLVNNKVMVVNRTTISQDSVILRKAKPISLNRHVELLTTQLAFFREYGEHPSEEFKRFTTSRPTKGYQLTHAALSAWPVDPDGKHYYRTARETFEVGVGTIISVNGFAVTADMGRSLTFESLQVNDTSCTPSAGHRLAF